MSEKKKIHIYDTFKKLDLTIQSPIGNIGYAVWSDDEDVMFLTTSPDPLDEAYLFKGSINGHTSFQFKFPSNLSPGSIVSFKNAVYCSAQAVQERKIHTYVYKYEDGFFVPIPQSGDSDPGLKIGPSHNDVSFSVSSRRGRLVSISGFDASAVQPIVRPIFLFTNLGDKISLDSFDYSSDGRSILVSGDDRRGNGVIYLCDISKKSAYRFAKSKVAAFTSSENQISYAVSSTLGGEEDSVYVSNFDGSSKKQIYGPVTLWRMNVSTWLMIVLSSSAILGVIYILRRRKSSGKVGT